MLGNLIPELTEHIATYLPLSDLRNLRLTSRSLRANSARAFFDLAFHTVNTDLTAKSLRRLSRVSRHPHARLAVNTLRIGATEQFGPCLGYGTEWARDPERRLAPEQLAAVVGAIHTAVLRFPNCRAYKVTDNCLMLAEDEDSPELTFTDGVSIVHALLVRPGVQVSSFSIDLASSELCLLLARLDLDLYATPAFRASWAGVRELKLHYDLDAVVSPLLVAEAVNLHTLSLADDRQHGPEAFVRRLLASPQLPPLQTLAVSLEIARDTLTTLLARLGETLTDLKLHSMALEDDWCDVLSGIADFPRLRRLTLISILQDFDTVCFCPLVERELPGLEFRTDSSPSEHNDGKYCVWGLRYSDQGSGMRGTLEEIIKGMGFASERLDGGLPGPRQEFRY